MQTVNASVFKAKCLQIMDRVNDKDKGSIRGRYVVRTIML